MREEKKESAEERAACAQDREILCWPLTFTVCTSWMATCTSARMEDLTRSMCRVEGATTTSGGREKGGEGSRAGQGRACRV